MNYLQLHDGPDVFPPFTGKLQPLKKAADPFAPGAPVIKPGPFLPFSGNGCAAVLPGALQLQNAASWNTAIQNVTKLYEGIVKKSEKKGSGAPLKTTMAGAQAVAVLKAALKYLPQIVSAAANLFQGFTAQKTNAYAQNLYNQNAYGMQGLCEMSKPVLESQIAALDSDIAAAAKDLNDAGWATRGTKKIKLAVLSKLRLIYGQQLDLIGGTQAPGKGLFNIGLIAAALSLLR